MSRLLAVARKELRAYFVSPMAAIFVGTFLLAALFSFFWVETFFARNIADLRPLFRWMPALLVFLVAALTMRQWSEEERMGTLEVLLTLPVRVRDVVIGKYLAVLALVAVALLLTAGLPVTVSRLGDLDWGPVFGGYLGALLVASAYAAIGLFVSSRTDNQITALILTVLIGGAFYVVGSPSVVGFFGNRTAEILRALGTGSRFADIERGVLDLRDVVYYLSLTAFFLVLNTVNVDAHRWSRGTGTARYRRNAWLMLGLAGANLLALNLWLGPLHGLRLDLTEKREFSLSPVTRDLVANLRDPLLLRGYFSAKTHPLLAPLVPRIRDLMQEYAVASEGRVRVEFVDPRTDEELEAEANQTYGIRPVPFQVAGRYEASVVNSYFDILVKYGDQHVTLGFRDLIEVQPRGDGTLDVSLRNLEYDLTGAIKKVVYGFRNVESVFAETEKPIELRAYITAGKLPEPLASFPETLRKVAAELERISDGKFRLVEVDPDAPGEEWNRAKLAQVYGFRPIPLSLLSKESFYCHLVLAVGDELERIFPAADMSEAELRSEIEAALKRGASGFLKTVGLWTPPDETPEHPMMRPPVRPSFRLLEEQLRENYNVKPVDLSSGRVPGDLDVLAVISPQGLSDRERYAVDQYLMRGGAVIVAGGAYALDPASLGRGGLAIRGVEGGLSDLLDHYGLSVIPEVVMDERNEPFPVPVVRQVGMFQVREIRQVNYPYFVDVRPDAMARNHPSLARLPALTLNWASPIRIDEEKNAGRELTVLLKSSPSAWTQTDPASVQPDFRRFPGRGFETPDRYEQQVLAVSVRGVFESYFKDRPMPPDEAGDGEEEGGDETPELVSTVPQSVDSARLVVVGSGEFVDDLILGISRSGGQDRYLNNLQFFQNLVDWAVQDEDLLRIRSRGAQARLLSPTTDERRAFIEGVNYAAALALLVALSLYGVFSRRRERPLPLVRPASGTEGR